MSVCQGLCRRDIVWGLKESQDAWEDAWDPRGMGKGEQAKASREKCKDKSVGLVGYMEDCDLC